MTNDKRPTHEQSTKLFDKIEPWALSEFSGGQQQLFNNYEITPNINNRI